MAKWTADQFKEEIQKALGEGLVGLALYGSHAAGDHLEDISGVNLMILARPLSLEQLQALAKPFNTWMKQGHPAPLVLTPERLKSYAEVFPIEMADIRENHQMLLGADPFEGFSSQVPSLRWELEHELQGKLLRLKTRFMMTQGKEKHLRRLLTESLSTFLVLLKNALRLYGEKPPAKKMEAVRQLGEKLGIKTSVFETVGLLKKGERIPSLSLAKVFGEYLRTLEAFAEKIKG
ncbi:MAG TPA: hypothetical protein VMU88_09975 [bacterium]|nr:hypothetical protein [bacterium]